MISACRSDRTDTDQATLLGEDGSCKSRRRLRGKPQSNRYRISVLQGDGSACPRKLAAFERSAIAFTKPQKKGLDVLARSVRSKLDSLQERSETTGYQFLEM